VADFMRRTPYVNIALSPTPSAADTEELKAEAVNARLREFQKAVRTGYADKLAKASQN